MIQLDLLENKKNEKEKENIDKFLISQKGFLVLLYTWHISSNGKKQKDQCILFGCTNNLLMEKAKSMNLGWLYWFLINKKKNQNQYERRAALGIFFPIWFRGVNKTKNIIT